MKESHLRTKRRFVRRRDERRCSICGRTGIVIEDDHAAGQNHDQLFMSPLCGACHALVHELRRQAGVDLRKQKDPVKQVKQAIKADVVLWQLQNDVMRRRIDAWARWADLL